MTDAERIAKLLLIRVGEVDVALTYTSAYDRAWEGTLDIGAAMAMLSDVRYDERLACTRIIEETIAGLPSRSFAREQVLQEVKEVIATRTRR